MDKALIELIGISRKIGEDRLLVQGGGGNTSVKTADGKYMYIKASGTALKDMNAKRGWRRLDVSCVLSVINDRSLAKLDAISREREVVNRLLLACRDNIETGVKPSIESHLHAMLDNYVIHLHPVAVECYVCVKNGKSYLERLFAKWKYPPLWIPYSDPGYKLGRRIAYLINNYKRARDRMPEVLFLEKHGLIVSAANPTGALRLVRKVIRICGSRLKRPAIPRRKVVERTMIQQAKLAIRKGVFKATGKYKPVVFFGDSDIRAFAVNKKTKEMFSSSPLTLIEVIYSNGAAIWLDDFETGDIEVRLKSQISRGQKESLAFLVKDIGLFVTAEAKVASIIRDIQWGSLLVHYNARRMGGVKPLNQRQQQFIDILGAA